MVNMLSQLDRVHAYGHCYYYCCHCSCTTTAAIAAAAAAAKFADSLIWDVA